MRNSLLAACLALLAACVTTRREAAPARAEPTTGRISALWEVVDKESRTRLGFVDRMTYENGQELYWIRDVRRVKRLGYVTTGNRGFKYVWHVGQRAEKAEFIGADTISSNTRRILDHPTMVELVPITLQKLYEEIGERQRKQADAENGATGEEGSGEEGE